MTPCKSSCEVDPKNAQDRIDIFTNLKKKVLDPFAPDKNENDHIPVSLTQFLALLTRFADPTRKYTGMRMYFASYQKDGAPAGIPDTQDGKLILIFVPTMPGYDIGGYDDLSECWVIYDTNLIHLPTRIQGGNPASDLAYRWIRNYRDNRRRVANGLNDNGIAVTGNNNFVDTNCLWYQMPVIAGGLVGGRVDCGMIQYIKDRMAVGVPNPIDGMQISFGAYTGADSIDGQPPYYQLTALFRLHQATSKTFLSLGSVSGGDKEGIRHHKHHLFDTDADTGLPCPPADPCSGSEFSPTP